MILGDQPVYCAEHIEQDPNSIYCKCRAPYQNEPGDKKVDSFFLERLSPSSYSLPSIQRCKEIVLKEFEYCYKHYGIAIQSMVGRDGYVLACSRADKLVSICTHIPSLDSRSNGNNAN